MAGKWYNSRMTEITKAIAAATPYGGYLGQVTGDYFFAKGLRGTHDAVFNGMDGATKLAVQPYMHDLQVPETVGNLLPSRACELLEELHRATLGAWGNYVGDMYNGGGRVASTEARREVAVGSTLIMAMLEADNMTWARSHADAHGAADVANFYDSMRGAITGDNKQIVDGDKFAYGPYKAMQVLAQQVNTRVIGRDQSRKEATAAHVDELADARRRQFEAGWNSAGELLGVALDLGSITAKLGLELTTLRPEVKAAPPNLEAEAAAIALGKIGAVLTHGTHVDAAFRDHMPTYATATIISEGGATKAAMERIRQTREESVHSLVAEGKEALRDGTRQQRGIFRMAVRLLRTRQAHGGTGSPAAIERQMRGPYWNPPRR